MNIQSILNSIRRTARFHGKFLAFQDVTQRGINRLVYYKTLQCVVTEKANWDYLALPPNLRFSRLGYRDLLEAAKTAECQLSREFVESALAKGDECYGIFDGTALASYGWYSRKPTLMENNELRLHFDSRYVYMYKGLTLDRYRGQRLHAIGKTRALTEYQARGLKGMLSYIESNNFNSLKSSYRMGACNCGQFHIVRIAGNYLIRTQRECGQYKLVLHRNLRENGSIARTKSWIPRFSGSVSIE
jgi:hypothetical protein